MPASLAASRIVLPSKVITSLSSILNVISLFAVSILSSVYAVPSVAALICRSASEIGGGTVSPEIFRTALNLGGHIS